MATTARGGLQQAVTANTALASAAATAAPAGSPSASVSPAVSTTTLPSAQVHHSLAPAPEGPSPTATAAATPEEASPSLPSVLPAVARPAPESPIAPKLDLSSSLRSTEGQSKASPSTQKGKSVGQASTTKSANSQENADAFEQAMWRMDAQDQMKAVRELRSRLLREAQAKKGAAANRNPAAKDKKLPAGAVAGNAAAEDIIRKRLIEDKQLAESLASCAEAVERSTCQVAQSCAALQQTAGNLSARLSVVEKRLDLRSGRPPGELIRDLFQQALEFERQALEDGCTQLAKRVEASHDLLNPLIEAKDSFRGWQTHLERVSRMEAWHAIDEAKENEALAIQFCRQSAQLIASAFQRARKAHDRTSVCMKTHLAELFNLRYEMEKEVQETAVAISVGEKRLDRLQRRLQSRLDGGGILNSGTSDNTDYRSGALLAEQRVQGTAWEPKLTELRAKVRSGAYAGLASNGLEVALSRYDKDGAGALDQDNVRSVFRRTLKIPASVISDSEIVALVTLLDIDRTGFVAVSDLVDFLNSDGSIEALEDQIQSVTNYLDELREAHQVLQDNLRCKNVALKIDEACQRVSTIKGLNLDKGVLGPCKPPEERRHKPLDKELIKLLRSRITAACYPNRSSRSWSALCERLNKDGSGKLGQKELKLALRKILRIPPMAFSEANIASLWSMLDTDRTGSITVDHLISVVGVELEADNDESRPASARVTSPVERGPTLPVVPTSRSKQVPAQPLSRDRLEAIRAKLASIYGSVVGTPADQQLQLALIKFTKGNHEFDAKGLKNALREAMGVSAKAIPDHDIQSLFASLCPIHASSLPLEHFLGFIWGAPAQAILPDPTS